MDKKQSKIVHEKFHASTSIQKKIIDKNNFTYRLILDELSQHVEPGNTILDIGCGAGTLCFYFANN